MDTAGHVLEAKVQFCCDIHYSVVLEPLTACREPTAKPCYKEDTATVRI